MGPGRHNPRGQSSIELSSRWTRFRYRAELYPMESPLPHVKVKGFMSALKNMLGSGIRKQ
eukprot:1688184-Amphidinium_carterae.1